jgi:hypothetical protein
MKLWEERRGGEQFTNLEEPGNLDKCWLVPNQNTKSTLRSNENQSLDPRQDSEVMEYIGRWKGGECD